MTQIIDKITTTCTYKTRQVHVTKQTTPYINFAQNNINLHLRNSAQRQTNTCVSPLRGVQLGADPRGRPFCSRVGSCYDKNAALYTCTLLDTVCA